jgi:hypothetical protein
MLKSTLKSWDGSVVRTLDKKECLLLDLKEERPVRSVKVTQYK